MKVLVEFPDAELDRLFHLAQTVGFMRLNERKAVTLADKKEGARWYINRMIGWKIAKDKEDRFE